MEIDKKIRLLVQDRRLVAALAGLVGLATGVLVGVTTDTVQKQVEQFNQNSRTQYPNLRPPFIVSTPQRFQP